MPSASIQFSQVGSTTGGAGDSVLGYLNNTQVTFTDSAGGGATSWAWSIVSWPGPLASAPTVNNSTTQTANATPTTDGVYIVQVIRTDSGPVVTTDTKFFAIADSEYGYYLPSPGQTGNMTNISGSAAAQAAGWWGRADGNNVWLDVFFRFLRSSIGRFLGLQTATTFSSSSPTTVTYTDGTTQPYQLLTLTGTGLYTIQIANTSPVPPQGKSFLLKVAVASTSGGLAVLDGIAGSSILALVAPPSGTTNYTAEIVFNGSDWFVSRIAVTDPLQISKTKMFIAVSGVQTNNTQAFQRAGNVQIDPTKFPANAQAVFNAVVLTTSVSVAAVIQLYDVTAGSVVTASPTFPIQSTAQTPTLISTTLTLPSASHLYEVQFKMGAAGSGSDIVTVSYADVTLTWG
jgi:hypothetical protein